MDILLGEVPSCTISQKYHVLNLFSGHLTSHEAQIGKGRKEEWSNMAHVGGGLPWARLLELELDEGRLSLLLRPP